MKLRGIFLGMEHPHLAPLVTFELVNYLKPLTSRQNRTLDHVWSGKEQVQMPASDRPSTYEIPVGASNLTVDGAGQLRITHRTKEWPHQPSIWQVAAHRIVDVVVWPAHAVLPWGWIVLEGALENHVPDPGGLAPLLIEPFWNVNTKWLGRMGRRAAMGVQGTLSQRLGLPRRPEPVDQEELVESPRRFHGRLIETTGLWQRHFEVSTLAGAWLTNYAAHRNPSSGTGDAPVRVTGIWEAAEGEVYGHLGMYPAQLLVLRISRV